MTEEHGTRAKPVQQAPPLQPEAATLKTGIDPTLFYDYAELGYHYIQLGYRNFPEWKAKMLATAKKYGEEHIEPRIKEIWERLHADPDLDKSLAAIKEKPAEAPAETPKPVEAARISRSQAGRRGTRTIEATEKATSVEKTFLGVQKNPQRERGGLRAVMKFHKGINGNVKAVIVTILVLMLLLFIWPGFCRYEYRTESWRGRGSETVRVDKLTGQVQRFYRGMWHSR